MEKCVRIHCCYSLNHVGTSWCLSACSSVDVRTPDVNSETRVAIHQQNYLTPKQYEVLQMFICFVPDIDPYSRRSGSGIGKNASTAIFHFPLKCHLESQNRRYQHNNAPSVPGVGGERGSPARHTAHHSAAQHSTALPRGVRGSFVPRRRPRPSQARLGRVWLGWLGYFQVDRGTRVRRPPEA